MILLQRCLASCVLTGGRISFEQELKLDHAIALLILVLSWWVGGAGGGRYKVFLHFVFRSLLVDDWYIVPIFHTLCGGGT